MGSPIDSSFAHSSKLDKNVCLCNSPVVWCGMIVLVNCYQNYQSIFSWSYRQMMNLQGKPILCHFFRGGRYVRPWFSQLFFHKSGEFLCSLERKFPDLFKTHPPFVCSPLLMPSTACQTLIPLFFGTPCMYQGLFREDTGSNQVELYFSWFYL